MKAVALLLLASSAPAMAQRQAVVESPSVSPAQAAPFVYDLTWAQNVNLAIEDSGDDVVVRFDRPIGDSSIAALATAAGSRLADLRWNDTTLVLRPADGTHLVATASGRVLHIRFVPDAKIVEPISSSDETNLDLELALTRAQAEAAAGYPGRARDALAKLAAARPGDQRIERLLADAESAAGEIGAAAERYRILEADDHAARRVMAQAGGNVTAGPIIRDSDDFSQIELDVGGVVSTGPSLLLGAGIRHFHSRVTSVAGPVGAINDATSNATLADFTATGHLGNAKRIDLRLTTQFEPSLIGASLKMFAGPPERQARLALAYRVPELLTPEQAILGGFVSRAGVGGSIRPVTGLLLQIDAGWNGYGLAHAGTRSEAIFVTGSGEALLRRRSPAVAATYQIDAEYVQREDRRATGTAFIPLNDRENHTAQIVSSFSLSKLQFTAAAGWTVERFAGSNGPTANISASAFLGDTWRLEGSAGISSISRPGVTSAQGLFFRLILIRYLGRVK